MMVVKRHRTGQEVEMKKMWNIYWDTKNSYNIYMGTKNSYYIYRDTKNSYDIYRDTKNSHNIYRDTKNSYAYYNYEMDLNNTRKAILSARRRLEKNSKQY